MKNLLTVLFFLFGTISAFSQDNDNPYAPMGYVVKNVIQEDPQDIITVPNRNPNSVIKSFTFDPLMGGVWLKDANDNILGFTEIDRVEIKRFMSIDPKNQFASGYVGMGNNPVSMVDPDGQWVHIAIGAAIGGVVNLGMKAFQGKIHSWGDGFAAFGIGAVAGGLGAATGGATFLAAGGGAAGAGGFLAGAAGGLTGSAVSSPIQGLGNAAYFGDPYKAKDFGRDVLLGGLTGGAINGGIAAFGKTPSGFSRNFWNGDVRASGAGTFSMRNSSLLRQQGWARTETGRWSNISGGDMTTSFPDWIDPNGITHQGGTYNISANNSNNVAGFERFKAMLSHQEILGATPIGSALKNDPYHMAGSFVLDDIANQARFFTIRGGDGSQYNLTQMLGEVNGRKGVFEWLINSQNQLTHQRFINGGTITGFPNQIPR